jgi:carboxyl-terminal processing protease
VHLALLVLCAAPAFDAAAAWKEFSDLLRTDYAYLMRPEVDSEKVLRAFEARALKTTSAAAFVDVLQLLSHGLADPHVVVGPFDSSDWSVIPTNSDLFARLDGSKAVVLDVRAGSAAATAGLRPGATITSVDGRSIPAALLLVCGLPLASLSPPQLQHALNIALAGIYGNTRRLMVDGKALVLGPTSSQARALIAGPRLSVDRAGTIAVVRIENSLGDNRLITEFTQALEEVREAEALVIDLRNTPSGGNSTVARAILGHFVSKDSPYQVHTVPAEERQFGVKRKFVEYVMPLAPRWEKPVFAVGGRWTSSMGEGLMIGFDAIGVTTVGAPLAHLLGATQTLTLERSGAKIDLPTEALFHVNGQPREDFVPKLRVEPGERLSTDPVLAAITERLDAAKSR